LCVEFDANIERYEQKWILNGNFGLGFFVVISPFQLVFALLRVQFLAQYFSEPLVSGFVTAAAIHVLFSQIDTILGFTKPKSGGFGYLFRVSFVCLPLVRLNLVYK
jgi:MFS superfamily sulfate permease-like transporter